ncbi:rhomboid family intramembrane serine protease [Nocardioides sp.]|uniref:rhomboid family intramembrane serine protease n=1 Tax=Nocardioides sp. TaxID=35761 RepID=UPI002CDF4FD6|nr:rhomboid family intramembrane serine protease [Nocardioides sp.]HXH77227.1 rhomboid family intramembrane serine protease [Nocardioides sp.]
MRTPSYAAGDSTWRIAAIWSAGFVAVLWVSEIIDTVLGNRLDVEGIRPNSPEGLSGILVAPLLHAGFGHLMANTLPLLVLGFLVLLAGLRQWLAVTAIVWVVGGVGTWLTGGEGTVHLGASGLVFGWLTYLLLRGLFTRNATEILVGVFVFFVYGGVLLGVLPGQPGISWQGHLFGALGGVLAAWWLPTRRPAAYALRG